MIPPSCRFLLGGPSLAAVLFLLFLVALVPSDSVASRRPRQAGPDTPWEDLRSVLSSPEVLHIPTVIEWKEQCLDPMIFDQYPMPEPFHLFGYDIGYAPAGGEYRIGILCCMCMCSCSAATHIHRRHILLMQHIYLSEHLLIPALSASYMYLPPYSRYMYTI